jgi:hypothetical protein
MTDQPESSPAPRWAKALGVQPRAYIALTRAYFLMDLRSEAFARTTRSKPREAFSPLFWVVGQYLIVGAGLSFVLFTRVDVFFFALAALAVSMCVLATSIIVEFNEIVLNNDDLHIIGPRPVLARTYAMARMTNLLGYVLLMTAALNICPAIVGIGLRDSSWAFLPAYAIAALLGNLIAAAAVILTYTTVLRTAPEAASRELLAWTQVVLIMVVVYGGQLVFRDAKDTLEMLAYNLPHWVAFLPPAWLASFVRGISTPSLPTPWWIILSFLAAAIAAWALCVHQLSRRYAHMGLGLQAWRRIDLPAPRTPGRLTSRLLDTLIPRPAARVAYWLCATMLSRDPELRMRTWPALGLAVAALIMAALTSQLHNPLLTPGKASLLSLLSIYLLAVPIPTILHALQFSKDHQAGWLLRTSPVDDRAAWLEGMRLAVTWRIILPMLALWALVLAYVWRDPLAVALHLALAYLVACLVGHAAKCVMVANLPLTRQLSRGETLGSASLKANLIGAIALFLLSLHIALIHTLTALLIYLAALALLLAIARPIADRYAHRALKGGDDDSL